VLWRDELARERCGDKNAVVHGAQLRTEHPVFPGKDDFGKCVGRGDDRLAAGIQALG
jgi:hypothetical protein